MEMSVVRLMLYSKHDRKKLWWEEVIEKKNRESQEETDTPVKYSPLRTRLGF